MQNNQEEYSEESQERCISCSAPLGTKCENIFQGCLYQLALDVEVNLKELNDNGC